MLRIKPWIQTKKGWPPAAGATDEWEHHHGNKNGAFQRTGDGEGTILQKAVRTAFLFSKNTHKRGLLWKSNILNENLSVWGELAQQEWGLTPTNIKATYSHSAEEQERLQGGLFLFNRKQYIERQQFIYFHSFKNMPSFPENILNWLSHCIIMWIK